jgi:hypothetical protein
VWGTGEIYVGVWCGNQRERDHLFVVGISGRIILNGSSRGGMERGVEIYLFL